MIEGLLILGAGLLALRWFRQGQAGAPGAPASPGGQFRFLGGFTPAPGGGIPPVKFLNAGSPEFSLTVPDTNPIGSASQINVNTGAQPVSVAGTGGSQVIADSIYNGVDLFQQSGGIMPSAGGVDTLLQTVQTQMWTTYQIWQRPNGDTYQTWVT